MTLKIACKCDYAINLIESTKKLLSEKHDGRILLTGTKINSQFNIKDDTNKQHKHNLV